MLFSFLFLLFLSPTLQPTSLYCSGSLHLKSTVIVCMKICQESAVSDCHTSGVFLFVCLFLIENSTHTVGGTTRSCKGFFGFLKIRVRCDHCFLLRTRISQYFSNL